MSTPSFVSRIYEAVVRPTLEQSIRRRYPGCRISRLSAGTSKQRKYLLRGRRRPLILRVYPQEGAQEYLERAKIATELAVRGCRLRAPRRLTLRKGLVWQEDAWIEGLPLREWLDGRPDEDAYGMGRAVGEELARLHGAGVIAPPTAQRLKDRYTDKLCRLREGEDDLHGLRDELFAALDDADLGDVGSRTCVVHSDLHMGNILVDEGGRPMLIDYERICVGDRLYDVSTAMTRGSRFHAYNRGIAAGYGELDQDDWRCISYYHVVRKVEEYFNLRPVPAYLCTRDGWETRLGFLCDGDALKADLLGEGYVYE